MVDQPWTCAAIEHGITFYQNGTIAPCCVIDHTYRKDIADIGNQPFKDLAQDSFPKECSACQRTEQHGMTSYRMTFNQRKTEASGYQFLDIRNTNLCNYRCRICCADNSSQIAQELGYNTPIIKQNLDQYKDYIINPAVNLVYYTGGEPFINGEHWELLQDMVDQGLSKNIGLNYNTNMSTLRYKDRNIFDIWEKFRSVLVMISIDAVGEKFNSVRSGGDWRTVEKNILALRQFQTQYKNLRVSVSATVSILNIWFLYELLEYFKELNIPVLLTDLNYPDYLALNVIPDSLQQQALDCIDQIESYVGKNKCDYYRNQIQNNTNQHLFNTTVMQTLLLDQTRKENLFELVPFKTVALKLL